MRKILVCIFTAALLLANISSVFAIAVPNSVISENRDGRQLVVKTFVFPETEDPAQLIEEPFVQEGYLYSLESIVKEEMPFEKLQSHSETVTIETSSGDLSAVLGALAPTIPYDDGEYRGVLSLDHTSLRTAASGYAVKNSVATETKTIEGLDRNDPSYVPRSVEKNGQTLSLENIEWSVQSTSLAGDMPVPTQFMAVATYKGNSSHKVASGYTTSATYTGDIVSKGVSGITYTLAYFGEPVSKPLPYRYFVFTGAGLLLALACVLWFFVKKNASIYTLAADGTEYELIGRQRLRRGKPFIDLRKMKRYPKDEVVIEIDRRAARRLFGRIVRICLRDGVRTHLIEQTENDDYWFSVSIAKED